MVMTKQPLRMILRRPDMTGCLASWTIEMSQFIIDFCPQTAMRSQVLSDFIAKCNFQEKEKGEVSENSANTMWTLFTDGSSTASSGGGGIILISPEDFKVQLAISFKFTVTNNKVEYEALLAGLRLARHLNVSRIKIFCDSYLVVKQVLDEYKAANERMSKYMKEALQLLKAFDSWTLSNIDRSINQWADAL